MITSKTVIETKDEFLRKAMYEVFGGKCFYTGRDLKFEEMHIDHIYPKSKGGEDIIENYVLCSININKHKSGRYEYDFVKVVSEINKLVFVNSVVETYNSMYDNSKVMEHHKMVKEFLNEKNIKQPIERLRFTNFMRMSKTFNAIKIKPLRQTGKQAKRNDLYYHINDLERGFEQWVFKNTQTA